MVDGGIDGAGAPRGWDGVAASPSEEARAGLRVGDVVQRFGTLGIFLVLVIVASFWLPEFLTRINILNVLRQVAAGAGIMAVGMLFVILTSGIDLSVGSIAALGCVLSAYFMATSGYGILTSVVLVLLSGAACGAVYMGLIIVVAMLLQYATGSVKA